MKILLILLLSYLEDAQLSKSHRKNHFVGKLTSNHQDSKNVQLNLRTLKNGVKKYSILKKNGKTVYNIPKNQIFSPLINEHWIDIGGLKRDMLVFPAQTLVSLYQKPVSDFVGDHRMSSAVFFDDPLMKSSQASYHFLNSAKSSFPSYNSQQYLANQDPDLINQMEMSNTNRMLYDDPIPAEYKDMQGLQDSEEMLVGKIVGNAPKGTTLTNNKANSQHYPAFHPSTLIAPSYNENNNYLHSSFNNGLLEKILAPQYNSQFGLKQQEEEFKKPTKQFKHDMQDNMLLKPQKEINCDPVQLSEVANCTNSIDPLCKDDDLSSFRANGLHQHQTYRRVHQTPPLELNNMLNNEAQNYSEVLASAPKLSYSDPRDRPGQGENIAVRCSDDGSILSAKEAVSYWYNKACKDEKYAAHFSPEITQFAQLVWKNTNFMGMGRATKKKGDLLCTYIVARYSPQATKDGFAENVPQFDSRKICINRCIKDTDHVSVPFTSNEQSSKNKSGPEEKEKLLNHEAIFNKMKDITEEDRQQLQTRSEEEVNKEDKSEEHLNYFDHIVKSANNIQLEHAPIGYDNQDYSSFTSEYGKLTPEKLTENSKVPEINPEVRQSSKSAEYPLVIHSSATKRNSAKSSDKILTTRSKEEEDLDLEDDAASYKKPGNGESVLDLSSPKPHKHKGVQLSNLSHSSLINGDESDLTHPENVNTHHQNPLKERAHEMESEREDQEKDESDVEHDKYVEKMHRHYERIKAKSDEQKMRDRNRGAAFMERFLSSDVDGGSPSFEATASLWREPSKKKKRKRRKKKYDDEDDDNDVDVEPEKDNANNDDTAGKDEDATSRVFGKKVKNLADSEITDEYDASGKLIAKSVDSERPKTSHFKSNEYKNEQRTRPKEEGTLVNPHAPDQLSSDTEFNTKVTNIEVPNLKGSSSKQDNSSNAAGTHGKMVLLNQVNRESPVNLLDKQDHISSKDSSNIDHNIKSERLLKENINKDASFKLEPQTSSKEIFIKNIFKTEKLQTELKPQALFSGGTINSTTPVNVSSSISSITQPKATNNVVYHGLEKTRPVILEKSPLNDTEKNQRVKHLKMNSNDKIGKSSDQLTISEKTAKTDSNKINTLSKKIEKLGVVDLPKKALHDEISNFENFDTEPKFEKGSDAEIQYKINKKVNKVQSLNNDKEESEENSPNKLKTDFVKVKNEIKLQIKKKKKEDVKTIAHFEDIGEENIHPKNNDNTESNLFQSDSSLVLAEKTLSEINNTIVKNDIEAKAASVLRESAVMPVAFIHPVTAIEAKTINSAPQVVHKSLPEKPGPGRESDEEDLPVFQEVTDTRIPNNEEADIHELSRTAGMRPTRPVKRTVPGLRISKLTNDGLVDLMFLEKASPKTSDPATRHVLQTFFDSVGLKLTNAEPSSSYIQLIPTKDLDEFRKEMVEQHNKFRSIHLVKPLHLDKSLSKDAQSYAAYVAKHNSVAHSDPKDRPDIGESVAEMCTKEGVLPTAEHIVSKWYSEICNPGFDFKNMSKQPGTGHFTQIIWKDTDKLGVGLAVANHPNGDSCSYVVARYKSAGNYLDKIRENVLEGYFSREKCNLLESNVFSRNILARASHQLPISGSVRTMKGSKHSIKVKHNKKKFDEKQNVTENFIAQALLIPLRYQQSTELKQLILPSLQTNQLPAPPPQKLTISGLSKKNIEIDFEVREDVDEEPQSKSKILRHSKNDTVSDLDRKSALYSVLQNNSQSSANKNYKRTIIQREVNSPQYNDHEYSFGKLYFNEEKREKRSNEKNKSLEVAKKQEFIYPGFGNEDGSSASTPVHSFIINNQGGIFPIQTQSVQNVGLQSTLKKEVETSQPYQNAAQTSFTQLPVQQTTNLVTKPLFVAPDIPLSSSINYPDSPKLENYNEHLDNSHLQSQLVRTSEGINYNSPLDTKVMGAISNQPAVLGMPIIDQHALPGLYEYKTFNGEVNQTFVDSSSDLVRQKLLSPKSNETSEEDLGVPLCMLPAKGTKEALEITSKIFGNRTLPPAIMKKCNNTVLFHLKLFNNIKSQSPVNIDGSKKFIVPKSKISYRLQNSHLNKKDAEKEINKYFKSRHSNRTKHKKPFTSINSKNMSKKVKLNQANKFNFTTKNKKENSSKKALVIKDSRKPAVNLSIKTGKNNDNSDLENYLGNIVVKLHDLDADSVPNVDSYQSKKSNVKTQSQLEKKTDSLFSKLSHKNAIDKMVSIKPEKYVADSGHKRLLQIQDNVDSKQYVSTYSPMSHEIGMEQIHENNHIDEVSANSNSASYSTTELEVNDKPFSTNNQEALVSDHDTEAYSLSSNNGQEQEVFNNGFITNSNQHEISAIDNVKSNDVSEATTDSIQDPDHSQPSSNKEIENLKINVDSNESVQSVTEDDPALSAKYKEAEKTGNEPDITPLQTYSKELEKEVQRIPTEEIKDSNREANVVANHIATSFNWEDLQTPLTRSSKSVKNGILNIHDTAQDPNIEGLHDHIYDNTLVLDRDQRNVRSGKTKIENRMLDKVLNVDAKDNKFQNSEEQKPEKFFSGKENGKSLKVLRHFKQYQLKKLKDVHEKQLLKAELNKKIEEKELKKFSEDFLKEAEKLIKESNGKDTNKKKPKISKLNGFLKTNLKETESDSTPLNKDQLKLVLSTNNSKKESEKDFPDEKEVGSFENRLKLMPNHANLLPDVEISLRPQNPSIVEQSALMAINQLRAIHLAPRLQLSEKLSQDAQLYADELVQRHGGVLINSPILTRLDQGENLAIDCDPHDKLMSGSEAVVKWYKELCEKGYNFNEEPTADQALGTLHFTQMVWQSTKFFGVGIVTTKKNKMTCTIVVARFHPPGNIPRRFRKNVIEGLFDGKICASIKKINDAGDSLLEHTSSQVQLGQYVNHFRQHKSRKIKSSQEDEQIKHDSNKDKEKLFVFTGEKLSAANRTNNGSSENIDQEYYNEKSSLDEDDKINVESQLERAKQSHLAQKVLQQISENDEQKKVSKYYYTEPTIHKVTGKYKLKVITGDQLPNEDNYLGTASSSSYSSKEFVSTRGLIGKSNISLEALEASSHLKGSPLDELDDEPKLKFVRGNEKMDDSEDMITSNNRALKREDFTLKNISGDSDASILLWNRDEGGQTHPSQTFIRRNARMKNLNQSIKLPTNDEAGDESRKNNKMIYDENDQLENQEHGKLGFNEISDVQRLSKNSTHSEEFKGEEDQTALLNKYLSSNKLKMDNFKAIRLGDHLILHTISNSSLIENLNSKKHSKEFDVQLNLSREKPLGTGNNQLKERFEKEDENEKLTNEEGKPTEKKLDALNEQNESEKKPEDLVYESASGQKGRKKLNHLDLAHYEHAQNKKPGNNPEEIDQSKGEENNNLEGSKSGESGNTEHEGQEQQVKKPPPRKPPPGLKGHGEEEQADDNKLVAGNEMLNNEESKKPSKRPTFGLEPYKPISSASPTPLVISSPRPMTSSLDINAKLVQTLGPWPSISFSSFGSPVVLHIGATGFYEDDLAFLRIGLSTHNKLRKIHGSPPMEMDQELTAKAYRHAVSLTNLGYLKHESLRQNPTMELLPGVFSTMGENLFLGCYDGEYDISAEEAVVRWYGEVCSPGHCFNKTSQCSGTGHFSQVVWASSVRLGMAKATRMQNGLRCTYIVAKYFPEGNNHMFYNENVLKGNFNEKETCHDVIEALVTFETRNIDKANMVAQEKNLARLEFLKSLKDAEKQVTENINKELTISNLNLHNSSGCCGLIVNNLDKMKQSLPVNAGGSANGINNVHEISQDRLDLEEFKGTNNQINHAVPIASSRKVGFMSLKKIRNGSLLDLIKDQKYKMLNSTILAAPVVNSEDFKNPIKEAKVSYENSVLTARDPNLALNTISQHDDELEANGVTKSANGLNKDGNFVPDSDANPAEIDDLDLTAFRNKLDSEKQSKESLDHAKKLFLKQSENESKSDKRKQSQNNVSIEMLLQDQKKVKKLAKVNTRVEGGPNDPNSRVDEEKLNLRPPSQRKHTRLKSNNFPSIRKTQKHVSKQKPMIATNSIEDSGDFELSGDDKPKKEDFQDKFKKLSTQKLPEVNINVPGGPNDPAAKLEDMDNNKGSDATEEPNQNSKPIKSGNNAKDVYKNSKSNEKKVKTILNYKDKLQNSLKNLKNLENNSQIDSLTQDLAGDLHHEFESSTDVTSGIILHRLKNPRESYHLIANGIKSENVFQRPLKSVYLQSQLESETHDSTKNLKLNGEENSLNQRKPDFINDVNIADINHQPEEDRFSLDSDDLSPSPTISVKVECKISSENPDQAAPYLLSTKCGTENEKAFHGAISGDVSLFQLSALNAHNAYRHAHNAPSLVLNEKMSKEASEYAKEIAEAASLRHSNTEDGENIATVCRSKDELMTGQEASTIWYREVCDPGYDFSSALPGKAGHFTQVVWRNSRQFGIGRASKFHNGLLCTYVVARYRPAGNFIGEFAANVLQGHFRSPRECLNLARKRSGIGFPRSNSKEKYRSKRSKVLKPKISHPTSLSSYSVLPISNKDHKQLKKLPHTFQNKTTLKVEHFDFKNYKTNKTKPKMTMAPFEQVSHFYSKHFSSEIPFDVHYDLSSNKRGEISSEDDFVLFSVKSKEESSEPLSQIQLEYIPDQSVNHQLSNVGSNDYNSLISEDYIIPNLKKEKSALKDTKNVSYEENDVYNRENTHAGILQSSKTDAKNEGQNQNQLLDMFLNPYKGKNVQFSTKLTEREKALRNRLLKKKSSYEVSAGSRSTQNEKKETGSGSRRQIFEVSPKVLRLTPDSGDVKVVPSYVAILLPTSISTNEASGMSKKSESKLVEDHTEGNLQIALDDGSSSDGEVSEFELSTLSLHNLYRSLHESPPLTLDKKLTSEAKERADLIAGKGVFPKYEIPALADENIAEVCKDANIGELLTGTDATMLWYDTVCSPSYIFGVDWVQEKATPFTQVVWKDTTRLGVARSTFYKDSKKCSVVVAKYFPSKNKTAVVSNVVRGDYDAKSYCDGLGAVYPSSPGEEQSNNLVKTVLPKRIVTQNIQDFRQEALNLHNKFRAVHGAPAIKLDEDLCIEAEMYASKLATEGALRRSNSNDGENFARSCSQNRIPMTADEVVRKWYNEICSPGYSFAQDSPKSGTESFSQMIWKETSKMGIGKAISEEDGLFCTYVVSRYYKRGNIPVQFKENVVKGQFDFGYCESLGKSRQKVKRRDKFDGWKRTMDNNAMRRRRHFKRYHRRYRGVKYPNRKVFFTKDKRGLENLMKYNNNGLLRLPE